jgi:hypothetical protein
MAEAAMAPIEDLPADQRAVLSLLVRRGRGYAQIADALDIPEEEVRERAHAALRALAPAEASELGRSARERIDDYVLGQQSASERLVVYDEIEGSDEARAYADALGAALGTAATAARASAPARAPRARPAGEEPARERRSAPTRRAAAAGGIARLARSGRPRPGADRGDPRAAGASGQPSAPRVSRRGGALLLGLILAGAIAAIVLSLTGGGSAARSGAGGSASATLAAGTGATGANGVRVEKELGLTAPAGSGSSAVGVAAVLSSSKRPGLRALALTAEKLEPTHGFSYVAWLYTSPSSYELLGKAPPVTSNGQMSPAITPLSSRAGSFHELIVTRETSEHPSHPGQIVLHGAFALH